MQRRSQGGFVTTSAPSARDALAQRLREIVPTHGVMREVRMFGGVSFLVDERMAVAAGREGDLLVRTNPAVYDDLLGRGGEPAYMGKDRPMGQGWLSVPAERIRDDGELAYWVRVGVDSRNAS
jgi:TfoX/Sxy family transcriptional regulator of competence genes